MLGMADLSDFPFQFVPQFNFTGYYVISSLGLDVSAILFPPTIVKGGDDGHHSLALVFQIRVSTLLSVFSCLLVHLRHSNVLRLLCSILFLLLFLFTQLLEILVLRRSLSSSTTRASSTFIAAKC